MITSAGMDLVDLICTDEAVRSAHLLGLGEIHNKANAFHELARHLMPSLKGHGFSTLAVEIIDTLTTEFDDFNRTAGKDLALATAIAENYCIYKMPGVDTTSPKQLDTSYFQMLLTARDEGIEVIPVDLRQGLPDDTPRDQHLAKKVADLLSTKEHVIYWGGPRHLHKRTTITTKFKSMAEILEEGGYKVHSVAQIVNSDRYINFETILTKLGKTPYMKTKDLGQDKDKQALPATTVANGKFRNIGATESLDIFYSHWDALIFATGQ